MTRNFDSRTARTPSRASLRCLLPALAVAIVAVTGPIGSTCAQTSDQDRLVHRGLAYGDPSGDRVVPGLGLILELIGGDTAEPRLRLFGGMPGHAATLLMSNAPAYELDEYGTWQLGKQDGYGPWQLGPGSATKLLGADAVVLASGMFGLRGYFEVPWPVQAEGTELWVQGMETGGYLVDGSASVQMSHALKITREPPPADHDNRPRQFAPLPEPHVFNGAERAVEMVLSVDELSDVTLPRLDALLARALVREGDEFVLTLKVKVSGSTGVGVKIGVGVGGSFKITRSSGDRFIVSREVGGSIGAGGKLGTDDLTAMGKGEMKITKENRYHSIQGLGRGLRATLLGGVKESSLVRNMDLADIAYLREKNAQLVAKLEPALTAAKRSLSRLRARAKGWYARVLRGALASADRRVRTIAHRLQRARSILAAARAKLRKHADKVRQAALIVQSVVQGRRFVQDHYSAIAIDMGYTNQVNLGVPMPIDVATLGASLSGEWTNLPRTAMRFEVVPEGFAFETSFRLDGKVQGFIGLGKKGFEGSVVPYLSWTIRQVVPVSQLVNLRYFEEVMMADDEAAAWDAYIAEMVRLWNVTADEMTLETRLELGLDLYGSLRLAARRAGVVYHERGVGRTLKVSTGQVHSLGEYVDAIRAFLETGDVTELAAPMKSRYGRFSNQARRVIGFGAKIGGDISVFSLGLDEASALWVDPGRKHEVEITVGEALERMKARVQGALVELEMSLD